MTNDDNTTPAQGVIKHDIKNRLSNISLALEQLRFDIPDQTDDIKYYLDTVFTSCKKINALLDNL